MQLMLAFGGSCALAEAGSAEIVKLEDPGKVCLFLNPGPFSFRIGIEPRCQICIQKYARGMPCSSLAWAEELKMARHLFEEEQYLFDTAADFLTRMKELEKLREAVRLAEVAKALQSAELPRRSVNSKVVDSFAELQLRV